MNENDHACAAVQIRRAQAADLPAAMAIIEAARAHFKNSGIDQWQDGYPDVGALLRDGAAGHWYVAELDGQVAATFMAAMESDTNYAVIKQGHWRTSGTPYAVLHRIAVQDACKGCGIGACVVRFISDTFSPQGARSLRGDTHADNASMRRMLEKSGFVRCGVIHLQDGAPRDAFEALLPLAADGH